MVPWGMSSPRTTVLTALFALSCVADPAPSGRDPAAVGSDDTAAPTPAPTVTREVVPDQTLDNDHVFSQDRVHEIAIRLPDASWAALAAAPYEPAPAHVVIDGVAVDDVGLRLRGKIGSFRTLDGKPKFKIDFNRFVDDQRFYGLEGLSLNNSVVDCSYMKEPLALAAFAAFDVPASRSTFARVTVNDLDYGLYVVIETHDDRFVRRHWGEPIGNLYDGKYVWWPDRSYTLLDFAEGHDDLYQLEEGTEVGHADITAISTALAEGVAAGDFHARMSPLVDWDQLHRVWAVEQYMGQNDGYSLNTNNYRVYFRASDAKMQMVPWDYDYSFLEDVWWSRYWTAPQGNLVAACWADAACAAEHQAVVAQLLDAIDALDLPNLNTELAALTIADARLDPRRECSLEEVDSERARVAEWLTTRTAYMRAYWGL